MWIMMEINTIHSYYQWIPRELFAHDLVLNIYFHAKSMDQPNEVIMNFIKLRCSRIVLAHTQKVLYA